MDYKTIVVILTVFSLILGVVVWTILWHRNKLSSIPFYQLALILFGVGLACRLTFALFTPTFHAPDEQPHFKYVEYLYKQRAFPVQTSQTEAETNDWEYYQPPLYYLISAPIYWLLDNLGAGADTFLVVRAIRALSIVFWGINLLLTLKILQNLQISDQFIRIFVVSLVCLLPTYTFLSASINNDNLVITLGGAILYLLSSKSSYRQVALIGLLVGLALLTKMTAMVYIFAIAGVMTGQVLKRSLSLPTAGLHFLLIIGLAAVLFAPWALRNLQVYGHIYPEEVANVPETWRSMSEAFTVTLQKINYTFWSASGIHNRTSFLPQAGVYLTYLAVGGLLYGLFAKTKPLGDYLSGARGIFIAGTAFAIAINFFLALRFGMLYDQGQGRFLFPLLIPLAILLALGLKSISLAKYLKYGHIHAMGFFIIYVLPFTSYSLCSFPGSWVKWLYSNLSQLSQKL